MVLLERNTLVWKTGFSGWQKLEDTYLRSFIQNVVPNTPANAISDKWIWALATVPMLVNFLMARYVPGITSTVLTIAVIILNIIFLTKDISDLKKNGLKVESWLWLGLVLVPVYLFVRAAKTTKNMAPGIVWCVIFVIELLV